MKTTLCHGAFVDDVLSNLEFVSEVIKKVGLDVSTAQNGQEAILIAEASLPDIIIMDIRMPVMDGYRSVV